MPIEQEHNSPVDTNGSKKQTPIEPELPYSHMVRASYGRKKAEQMILLIKRKERYRKNKNA